MVRTAGPVDVFVSFTGADVAWAEWIAAVVEEAGYSIRFQGWDFGVGANFVAEMNAALRDAGRLVMVTSSRYWQSVMATAEWTAAFARDPASLVPIRIEDAAPPTLLTPIVCVDVFGVAEAEARARVVQALQGPSRPSGPIEFPGALMRRPSAPAVFQAPRRPAPLAGRDRTLAELRARLARAESVTLTQALAGPGGVGKTVLAAEYAWRHRSDYQLVWWIPCEQRSLILDSYVRLAGELDVDVPNDLETLPSLVHRALERTTGRWLLVFDNAPDHAAVAAFLPSGEGHVLITSRNPAWGGRHATIDVECLDRETSARYLLARACKAEPPESERVAADALAEEVGGLPLALAQAGSYLDAYGETLAGYLGLFRTQRARLLADASGPLDYQGTVHTAVSLALSRLNTEPVPLALLELLAFLGPETIPLDLLFDTDTVQLPADLADLAGPDRGHERNRLGIGPLRAVSLIERDAAGVKVHRLTQTIIRDRLQPDRRADRLGLAVSLVTHALDLNPENPDNWDTFAALLPSARAVADHTRAYDAHRVDGLSLLQRIGRYLWRRGDLAGARAMQEQVLASRRQILGDRHPDTLRSINNLASILQDQGDLADARTLKEEALAACREVLGDRHSDTLLSINNLAVTLWAQGDLAGARALLEETLAARREMLGDRHPDTLLSIHNLATAFTAQGDLAGARALFEETLAACREVLGDRHPDTLGSVNNLGETLQALGDLAGARTLVEQASAGYREVLGDRHPNTLSSIDSLGNILRLQGELTDARSLHEEALAGLREVFGERHPATVASAWNLYRTLGECDCTAAVAVLDRDLRWLLDEDPERLTAEQARIRNQVAEEVHKLDCGGQDGGGTG